MAVIDKNLFRLTRFLLLKLPLLFRFFAKFRSPQKRLLIIKTDAIGDYILFRNFIEVVKSSADYKDYQVDLLGNVLWQDIALKYDAPYVNQFIFVKAGPMFTQPVKVFKLAWRLYKANYEVTLQPSSTRTFINDSFAGFTAAKQIIGFESDNEGISARYKTKTDKFYTRRLLLPAGVHFEFERSRFFFDTFLNTHDTISSTTIPVTKTGEGGIVIFPGAGAFGRQWGEQNFIELIQQIKQQSTQSVYLAGGPGETALGEFIVANLPPGSVVNLIGQSTQPQMVELIGRATLVIANDTSAIHIAVAAKTKSVCILGGGHFERFAPYPAYFEYGPVCVFDKMDCYYCNWACIYKPAATEVYPCIGKISVARVWDAVLPLLSR
ncbi:glycosyltransferase family 9 protein [Mucilaginibacter sp.]|uniref:glycosyltransferase family 9 protein n=1 Tax=Mucilaginibacter sp. TaxID=1882438 RepID=UPI0025FAB21B|nr:glycosyltransferase family 9 protein [Mucilaginibacter sp.]